MYAKIIVGFNDRSESRDALALSRLLADVTGASLTVVGVVPDLPPPHPRGRGEGFEPERVRTAFEGAERSMIEKLQSIGDPLGADGKVYPSSSAARGLYDAAEALDADLVVVGSSSRSKAGRVVAGDVALQLLQGSPCAIALAPKDFASSGHRLDNIGVGIDGSRESLEALHVATALGQSAGATLRLLSAAGPRQSALGWGYGVESPSELVRDRLRGYLDDAIAQVPEDLGPEAQMHEGDAAPALKLEAERGVDLLCLGSRGFGPLRRVLLGSVSGNLLSDAPCPILVVPRGAPVDDEGASHATAS